MQKLQDSIFSILKTTSLSPAVFSFLQPTEDFAETPLGGILQDTKHGWLALGPKFCVVDLRNGLKVAAKTFGNGASHVAVTSVIELPHPLTNNSQQLVISLDVDDTGLLCVLHVNGSQILRCIQSDVVITELALCDDVTSGPFTCFDGLLMAGTQKGEVLVIDFNRSALIQALKDITKGNGHLIKNESNPANLSHIPLKLLHKYNRQGELSVNNDEHLTILLNEDSFLDNQFIFRNPDGTVRMKANNDHVRVTVIQYIPQLGTLAVGYNFGAFQLWNILDLALEFTSQVNVECLPVTHFGFQEPCDDPRAFCYLWVVFSVTDRFDEHEFPLAVMYSLTYQGKRILVDNKCLYQEFSSATIRFQVELGTMGNTHLVGGRCISTHTFSINTMLGEEGEDTMLNLCQLVWECWGERATSSQYGMLLFDLDQWYKDQMPATYQLQSNTFMSTAWCSELGRGCLALDLRLDPGSLSPYSHATRLEEHFYPNSLQYNCVCLNTSEAIVLHTVGIQRQIISSISSTGPSCLLSPGRLYTACMSAGLLPAYRDQTVDTDTCVDEQRKFLLSVALEARMSQFLKRCAQDWATGTHTGVGCSLTFLVDWAWKRAIELKENAKELISPLFTSATLPDRNVIRCLEHCVQQLSQLTGLLDAILTKCCNLIVPDALSEIEEKYKGIGTVSLYFQVIQWFLRVGLLPERNHPHASLPYPAEQLCSIYKKRRAKLHRIQGDTVEGDPSCVPSPLLYVDQLIVNEFGGHTVHQIWIRAGSECGGLYPPPSLYALLRLYLLPDISEEHKHSLLLYLLFDYSMIYDDAQYEAVIRRLMQFPPMFGLSTTVVRATQAFWHLDHRDFHFALDQLQCLTGNTLSDWQHQVVLSSLLAQKKSQAALQYLHVRKPAPIQNVNYKSGDSPNNAVNGHDKLEDWQSCCDLYLDRGLVFEALDVVRMCVRNAGCAEDKMRVLNYFFKGCRNSGQLSKVLQVSLLPFEEEVFIQYLRECDEPQTADILIMYYLQQARYLEAEQYNKQIKSKSNWRDMCRSTESVADVGERRGARDVLVDLMCGFVPRVAGAVARLATSELEPHVLMPKPMSFYVKPKSPKNTFIYKSSFIQDTIENASETWINKPKMKKGLKRAMNIDETPFICTPKLYKTKSIAEQRQSDSTPAKRAKLNLSPKTPKSHSARVSRTVSDEIATLLDMPDVQSPRYKSSRPETPHSILKTRRLEYSERDVMSPMESRYLGDSDEEMETASINTHFSDSTNKHLRFTIPTPTVVGSTPSPVPVARHTPTLDTIDHGADTQVEEKPIESPPKKFAAENYPTRKSYKDSVRARRSLSISANSSLSDDPNTSIESIADIPVTLINPKYSGERRGYTRTPEPEETNREFETHCYSTGKSEIAIRLRSGVTRTEEVTVFEGSVEMSFAPKTPKGRRSIRSVSESTPNINRSHSGTPERHDSPVVTTPLRSTRNTRSRSRTPEVSPRTSPLPAIPEMPKLELDSESHPTATMLSIPAPIRSRSHTPERIERVIESPRLEVIKESPTKQDSPTTRRSLRSRSRTPEVEAQTEQPVIEMPRSLRSRSKTPEKLMSPKKDVSKHKKSLSRIVLEANTFAKTKQIEKMETEITEEKSENIECTPMKPSKQMSSVMDVTFSPIFNKSVLQSSHESILSITTDKMNTDDENSTSGLKLPAFTSLHEVYTEESVLHSYQSSIAETSNLHEETKNESAKEVNLPMFTTFNEDIGKSVLHSYESSIDTSAKETENKLEELPKAPEISLNEIEIGKSVLGNNSACVNVNESSLMTSDSEIEIDKGWKTDQDSATVIQKEKEKIVEIEREIHEIEGDLSDDDCRAETDSGNEVVEVESPEESEGEVEEEEEESSEEEETSEESVVISINDSDSDSEQLQIDEQQDNMQLQTQEAFTNTEQSEKAIDHEILGAEEVIEDGEIPQEIIEISVKDNENAKQNEVSECTAMSTDPLNVAHMSMLTDDNSVIESEQSISLNYSEEIKAAEKHALDTEQDEAVAQIVVDPVESLSKIDPSTMVSANECQEQNKDEEKLVEVQSEEKMDEGKQNEEQIVMESVQSVKEEEKRDENVNENQKTTNEIENKMEESEQKMEIDENAREAPVDSPQVQDQEKVEKELTKEMNVEITTPRTRRRKSTLTDKTSVDVPETITETVDEDIEKHKPRTRRQSSNKIDEAQELEPKTPRKKTESTSEKPETIPEPIPETPEIDSPRTRRRSKTPNTEVRRILTRRASRELSEKDDEMMPLEELTPRRRTRANSKKDDDTASVASESSVKSGLSKASEEEKGIRKGRKTLLSTKTDLTVIPETPAEDSTKNSEDIDEYSTARRVTRHQKAVLERTPVRAKGRRVSHDEDSRQSFEAQPSEPETLLDKTDSEVHLDPDDYQNSPDSLSSSASKYRGRRAASETKSVKAARIGRRTSVDVVVAGSGSEAGSPTRGRRASFTRACQAIHTPKGRRTSTDIKKGDIDSNPASPATSEASGTPARRSSRRTSTQSLTGTPDPGKRTRKGAEKNQDKE